MLESLEGTLGNGEGGESIQSSGRWVVSSMERENFSLGHKRRPGRWALGAVWVLETAAGGALQRLPKVALVRAPAPPSRCDPTKNYFVGLKQS